MRPDSHARRHRDWIVSAREMIDAVEARGATPTPASEPPIAPIRAKLPVDFFPGYALEREVHSGGQGVVYAAIQKSTGRRVALKALRESVFSTPLERARFEREVQILAGLRHANIVTIHDSGSSHGQLYLVMDFIDGQALDRYGSAQARTIRELLVLFAHVCEAVDAAHVRGIIHRDIKPGNILVDRDGRPHVLDFGLAKMSPRYSVVGREPPPAAAVDGTTSPDPLTETGQFVGSLPWSAPEQADAATMEIDTRSDVYSLGVVLYQLLTGRFPYDVVGPVRRVLDNIAHVQPLAPRTVRKQIDDEVETIILKCLCKERERRYQTAGELGRDLGHYLRGEPIEAKRDSGWYLLRKTLGRYRLRVTVAASFVLLISGATIALSVLYAGNAALLRDVERARDRALAAQGLADERLDLAQYENYASNIAAAAAAIAAQDGGAATRRLMATNPALRDWEWRYLVRQADQSVATWNGPADLITSRVCLSPDGRYVAASFWMERRDGAVRVWSRDDDQPIGAIGSAPDFGAPIGFTEDGSTVLAVNRDGGVWRFDLARRRSLYEHGALPVNSLADSWPPRRIALTWTSSGYGLGELRPDREPRKLPVGEGWASARTVDSEGRLCALGMADGRVIVWDIESEVQLTEFKAHHGTVFGLAFSPDGLVLATGSEGGELKLWGTRRPTAGVAGSVGQAFPLLHTLACGVQRVGMMSFSPDGALLAAPCEDKTVRIFGVNDGDLRTTLLGHTTGAVCANFGSDGRWLLSVARGGVVKLWDLRQAPSVQVIRDLPGAGGSVAFAPDGAQLLLFGQTASVIDVRSARSLYEYHPLPTPTTLGTIVPGPAGLKGAFADDDGRVWLWAPADREQPRLIGKHHSNVRLAGQCGSHVFASADADAGVLWDWDTGLEIGRFDGPGGNLRCLALSGDGTRIAMGTDDAGLLVLNGIAGTTPLGTTRAMDRSLISCAAFSPDGAHLAAGSDDGTVTLLDAASGRVRWKVSLQIGDVWCLAFSPIGNRLAVGGRDRSVRVLDPRNGQELLALRGPTGTVMGVAFSPDGNRIAASCHSREVFIWDAAMQDKAEGP